MKINILFRKFIFILLIQIEIFFRDFPGAEKRIKTTLKNMPDDPGILLIAQKFFRMTRDWEPFYEIYFHAEKIYPNQRLHVKRNFAFVLMNFHRYKDAIPNLLYCVENWNLNAEYEAPLANVHARLAICYAYLDMWDLATNELEIAEEMAPWDLDVIYGKLLLLLRVGKLDKALHLIDEKISQYPKAYPFYFWKAQFFQYYMHDIQGSLQYYDLALKNVTQIKPNYFNHFFSTTQFAGAQMLLEEATAANILLQKHQKTQWLIYKTKLKVFDIDLREILIYCDILSGNPEKAEKKCSTVLSGKPYKGLAADYWFLSALAQQKQGRLDDSLLSINRALELDSNPTQSWNILGNLQMQKQEWQAAITTYQKLLVWEPFDFCYWKNIAICHHELGDVEAANDACNHAIHLNPYETGSAADWSQIYQDQRKK